MYALVTNNRIIDVSEIKKTGYIHVPIDYSVFQKNKNKYKKINGYISLKNGLPEFEKKIIKTVKTTTQNEILEDAVKRIEDEFEEQINQDIKYKNGYYYKPRYASESYESLISAELAIRQLSNGKQTKFPMQIWDSTKKHGVMMSLDELVALATFLANIYEKMFQAKKQKTAKLLGACNEE